MPEGHWADGGTVQAPNQGSAGHRVWASAAETRERYRAGLYEAHKAFQGLMGQTRADASQAHAVPLPTPGQDGIVAIAKTSKATEYAMDEEEEERERKGGKRRAGKQRGALFCPLSACVCTCV